MVLDSTDLIRELVAIPGPPGEERAVRDAVAAHVRLLGCDSYEDSKGNLVVPLAAGRTTGRPSLLVTAHLDEIALMVLQVEPDGAVRVTPLGGAHPWKWGEQPVELLAHPEPLPGVLSFGGIHTSSPAAVATHARTEPLTWEHARVFTGLHPDQLAAAGVHPGTRVVLARSRRTLFEFGPFVSSWFLDDRADLAVMLLALEQLRGYRPAGTVLFAATVGEEVGGEGAAWLAGDVRPDVCVALEIGPTVPESPFLPDAEPTVWVADSFAAPTAEDNRLVGRLCADLGLTPHWQALSRGGSDASTAAQKGMVARPITLGLPVENSHGWEIMHRDAPATLARLLVRLVQCLAPPPTAPA